jgi:hypothetical protein
MAIVGALLVGLALPAAAGPGVFQPVGKMMEPREFPDVTLLSDGRVLVTGGFQWKVDRNVALATAEVFDPTTDSFTRVADLATTRFAPAVVSAPDGRAFFLGGVDDLESNAGLKTVEMFDATTGKFAPAGNLVRARRLHTAARLPDGRIFVVGGAWGDEWATRAEVFDPATGKATLLGPILAGRGRPETVSLPDGRVAIIGGAGQREPIVRAIEIFDPKTGFILGAGRTVEARVSPAVVLLPDGRIVIAGGWASRDYDKLHKTIEIYDPGTRQSIVVGQLTAERASAQAALLKDGTILIAGGSSNTDTFQSADLFDPATGKVTLVANAMTEPRTAYDAVRLLDGRVLFVGGWSPTPGQLATAEVYVPGE